MVRNRLIKEKSEEGLKISFIRKGINPVCARTGFRNVGCDSKNLK